MSGNLAWNCSMMAFSTSWDLPGWLDQKSIEAAGLTPLKSMSAAAVAAAGAPVDGPPQADSAAAPAPAPASPRKCLRSRFNAMVDPLDDADSLNDCFE